MISEKKVLSSFDGLDKKLDYIRAGDNIVFRVINLEFFRYFAKGFVKQAKQDARPVHYIRFGKHKPMLENIDNVIVHKLDPNKGFESITVQLYTIIKKAGHEAFFIFDNISILGEYWNTDLMLGNFFRVICPYLTNNEDVAIFPLRRGEHSYDCIETIRENTQIFLDVFYKDPYYYVTPLKVQDRYNTQTFLTHRVHQEDMVFEPLTYSTSLARYYQAVDDEGPGEQLQDSWDRYFQQMQMSYAHHLNSEENRKKMIEMLLSEDPRMTDIIFSNFKYRDYIQVHNRMVGTGKIGGKAVGMLLARKIIERHHPEVADHFEPDDSYFIGSDIFYTYIIYNQFWDLWMQHKQNPEDVTIATQIEEKLRQGKMPLYVKQQLKRLLDYYGNSPIIIRSSSLLEDGYGNAFAGKYESVFSVNGGTLKDRLEAFENAIRIVYASTMSPSALEYRRRRNLLDIDEQMALLVQRVSGSRLGNYLFPMAAGVGYSFNSYPWSDVLDKDAGMLRIVAGLGTRAVDRTPGDYPRLVNLDKPKVRTYMRMADRQKYSQHYMDVLDLEKNELISKRSDKLRTIIPTWQQKQVYTHNYESERMFRERGDRREILFVDCDTLLENEEFITSMRKILDTLQEVYHSPVDIEYAININEDGEFMINLLQCRPLLAMAIEHIELPVYKQDNVLLNVEKNTMGTSRSVDLDYIVYVDPYAYYTMKHSEQPNIAREIGKINQQLKDQGHTMMLITPGRIGTSSPELGVPVTFAEISGFNTIMEVAYSKAGYMPELSFGSHMFQDLVEAETLYVACMENKQTKAYDPDMLEAYPCLDIVTDKMKDIIKVYQINDLHLTYNNQIQEVIIGKK